MTQFIVITGQVVGGRDTPIEVVYSSDDERFRDREAAIKHGLRERGSDDFNIGVLERGRLVSLDWMYENIDADDVRLRRISDQIGLRD